ncbi:MAG: hypothetical protein OXH63_16850, partial [Gemmatimonadetes bacterium]|nr:hypothetical protein [Gemmatimonadota bacterium]
TRLASKRLFELVQKNPTYATPIQRSVTGFLSFRKPTGPLPTIELDEDSFDLAYSDLASFIDHSVGQYASLNPNQTATVYEYSTGSRPSVNNSHGEGHQELGWHNAIFFGVVGPTRVLDTIQQAVVYGMGVPDDVLNSAIVDVDKRSQIHCRQSDYIDFNRPRISPALHIEDGLVWRHYDEQDVWYSNADWLPSK